MKMPDQKIQGKAWYTYVLCYGNNPENWYTMNVNPHEIAKRHADNPGTWVERWHYFRTEQGDQLIKKEKICQTCYPYGDNKKIYNANQWIDCPVCSRMIQHPITGSIWEKP